MKYTDLIFDLYGTLVDIHTDENNDAWEKTALYFGFHGAGYSGKQLREAFSTLMTEREAKAGQSYECYPDIPFEQIMTALFKAKGIYEHADTLGFQAAQLFRILSIEYIKLYPYVKEALAELRSKGYRLWLLSNAQHVFTAYELKLLELDNSFDGVYLSSDYGCRKPDIRFYNALIDDNNLDISKCLMIGNDRQTDIAGAKAAGLATLYMHTNLTPSEQSTAAPLLCPGIAPSDCNHFEYEGYDWTELTQILQTL